jgi:hypothetical protein
MKFYLKILADSIDYYCLNKFVIFKINLFLSRLYLLINARN